MSSLTREIPNVIAPGLPMLRESMAGYLPADAIALVERAYAFADAAHNGEVRISGEPYIAHPLATAYYLSAMHLDPATIAAGLLHDVVEDTPVSLKEIEDEFGNGIAALVDGVTKFAEIGQRRREW